MSSVLPPVPPEISQISDSELTAWVDGNSGSPPESTHVTAPDFLSGGGELGALMRAKAWGDTPLGRPEHWPQSLKTVVRILLTSRYQMWMGWGKDLSFFYNDAYRPTLGVKHAWALGCPAREVWKEIWPDIAPRIEHVLESGTATWDEGLLLFLERNGYPEETYHTFSYSPLADDRGEVVGMLCVVTEETDRVIGERRLSSLRELASEIAGKTARAEVLVAAESQLGENLKDLPFTLTYLFSEDGKANLAGVSGVTPGHPIAPAVIDPENGNPTWPAHELLESRTVLNVGDLQRRFDKMPCGAWKKPPNEAVVAPIAQQGQDVPAGFLVAAVNPHRRLDQSYLGFITLVAGQIASGLSNAHAYEEERRRAEALAEIDRAKTAFFSNVSHEFRTPLTLMLSPLEDVLADRNPLSNHRPLVQLAHRNGVRLLKLVNSLLDFSRIEAGRVQATFEPVDLAVFTAELSSNFRSAVERAGLRLVVDCSPLPHQVYLDRDMWEKVIFNLISNAFKFTFEGEIALEVKPSLDCNIAEVTVRDTGTGIPRDDLSRLFERFSRVENARGRSIEGTGIGLALVQELVKIHGGTIGVASQVGKGSAFTVRIPFGTAHLPAGRITRARIHTASRARAQAYVDEVLGWLSNDMEDVGELVPPPGSDTVVDVGSVAEAAGRLVLLADDNLDMRNYLQRLLSTAGFRIEAVTNGEDALVAAQRLKPDLVLSDVMMPQLDGFGLLRALRSDPILRDTPVLLLSARAGEEAKVEGLSAGADDYLTKPFSARELLARVRTTLSMAAMRREAARVENELRRQAQLAQERTESILASINDGFLALDQDWRFTYVNAAAERMFKQTSDRLIGKNLWEVFPESHGSPSEANYRRAMTDRVSVSFENYSELGRRWLDVRVYPARDGGLSVYFQDITERKRAEDALRLLNETLEAQVAQRTAELQDKEARLRTIFETSFTYQGLMTLDGTLLDANATSLSGIGGKLEEVAGKPFWDTSWFTGTPGMPEIVRAAIPIVAGGETMRREIRVNLPVGGYRWFDFQMRPVRDRQGKIVAIVPEAVEVTLRRKAEEALRQAQKMESIGQLTGGVAHDFNNLLTIIMGNLEALQRQLKGPTETIVALERLVDGAMRGAQRAASLTHRLLAFSRQQPLDPRPLDVGRLVAGMSDLLHRTIGEQIAVESVLAGGLWRTSVDANQLEIAIINLAVNARDAMPNGGYLTIETANVYLDEGSAGDQDGVVPGQYVMVAVTDNGSGMTPATLAKAFEPFFTTKDVGHGTGLGLSQVYGFVKQSRGHVKIYSELGDGTTVKIYLPRMHSEEVAAAEEAIPKATLGRDTETILIVEDDDDVRRHTHMILIELGYNVVESPNGRAALEIIEQRADIQLLFTDVGLPGGMNGRKLAEEARLRRRNLRVLFTTGYARNAIVHDGRLDPGVQLITKPFTYAGLAAKIRDVLDARVDSANILVIEDEVLIQMLTTECLEELGFRVEVAGSAVEAKAKLQSLVGKIDAAIVDVGLPDAHGDSLVVALRIIDPALPIVIASGHDDATLRNRFDGYSLIGFLSKPYTLEQLRCALRSVGILN
jgi:PAS domain S-box-containing protein